MKNKLKRRSFTCTDDEWDRLQEAAQKTGLSISQIIRIKLGFIKGAQNEKTPKQRTDITDND